MRKIGEEMKNTRQYSNKSLFWRDFFTGIKRFWMLLVLIVMLFVNLTFCIGGYFYSPVYIMERRLKVFADDQTEIETLNKQLINSFSDTFCYSQLKQDIIERMSPKYNSFSAEVLLPEDDNGVLSVRISSDNAYNSQVIMALFCDVYSEYARYITGNSSIAFENAGQEKILFEGFDWKKTILIGSGTGIIFCFILL
ncbi:hypothetical protein, partial [Anaerostipes sp.]|uniref:hypothetical protein n=1 Tax=Anaerostipes sp. TaxID=1872530 RepID=UPI002585FBD3